jgi:hypothetical protein
MTDSFFQPLHFFGLLDHIIVFVCCFDDIISVCLQLLKANAAATTTSDLTASSSSSSSSSTPSSNVAVTLADIVHMQSGNDGGDGGADDDEDDDEDEFFDAQSRLGSVQSFKTRAARSLARPTSILSDDEFFDAEGPTKFPSSGLLRAMSRPMSMTRQMSMNNDDDEFFDARSQFSSPAQSGRHHQHDHQQQSTKVYPKQEHTFLDVKLNELRQRTAITSTFFILFPTLIFSHHQNQMITLCGVFGFGIHREDICHLHSILFTFSFRICCFILV